MTDKPLQNQQKPTAVLVCNNPVGDGPELQKIFESLGFTSICCKEPMRALRVQDNKPPRRRPGIFLVDMILPQTSGYEITRRIIEAWPDPKVPVIVMSNHLSVEDELEASNLGALAVIKKPVSVEALKQILEKEKIKKLKSQIGNMVFDINYD